MTDGAETDVVGLVPQISSIADNDFSTERPALAAVINRLLLLDENRAEAVAAFANFIGPSDSRS